MLAQCLQVLKHTMDMSELNFQLFNIYICAEHKVERRKVLSLWPLK